jgi:hypothetical protein
MTGFESYVVVYGAFVALISAFFQRHQIDDFIFRYRCRAFVKKFIRTAKQTELMQLLEIHNCYQAIPDQQGWDVSIRLTNSPTDTWPTLLHAIDDKLCSRLVGGHPRSTKKEDWYSFARQRSDDLEAVVEAILDVRLM